MLYKSACSSCHIKGAIYFKYAHFSYARFNYKNDKQGTHFANKVYQNQLRLYSMQKFPNLDVVDTSNITVKSLIWDAP